MKISVDWQIGANIAAVLGFAISTVHACLSLFGRRTNIGVSNARIYAVEPEGLSDYALVFIECIICNRSTNPVSITGGTMLVNDQGMALEAQPKRILAASPIGKPVDQLLKSTGLPIALQPREARRCILLSYHPTQYSQKLQPLRVVKAHEAAQQTSLFLLEEDVPQLPVSLHLWTSKKAVYCDFQAEARRLDKLFAHCGPEG